MQLFDCSKCVVGLVVLASVLAIGAGCDRRADGEAGATGPKQYPYRIVTTIAMVADVARNVAGDKATVDALIGEGVDPHLYKPTRDDVVKLNAADVILYNGLMLEGKMGDTLVRIARTGKPVQAVTEAILADGSYVMTGEDQHYDPHVWMDVGGWMRAVEVITKILSEYDPANADAYRRNADAYLQQLKQLDDYARTSIASIPESQRVLVTAHDAFGYLGRAYGIEVRGIQGLSTESEAGVMDIESLVTFLVDRRIPAVFVETSVADKNVRALVEGTRARGHGVSIGGSLFSDAMGSAGTYEGTYIGMIDHNITTLTRALGGTAPQRGMQGKLGGAQ
jgi:manganese/zinc/iron transport system substrate-binding protein